MEKIEALHIHDLPLVETALGVARRFNIPVVAHLHEDYQEAVTAWNQRRCRNPLDFLLLLCKRPEESRVQQVDKMLTLPIPLYLFRFYQPARYRRLRR
jgi:hypothetical protein